MEPNGRSTTFTNENLHQLAEIHGNLEQPVILISSQKYFQNQIAYNQQRGTHSNALPWTAKIKTMPSSSKYPEQNYDNNDRHFII